MAASETNGTHEVLAITEKVVLRVEDLLTWITEAADWSWGLSAVYNQNTKLMPRPALLSDNSAIDLAEVDQEKEELGQSHWDSKSGVVVLSFPRYCRYRGILKRLEGVYDKWLRAALVVGLGGFTVPCRNTRVLYCRETFDYPDLEGHELLCNHLAPKLKGRPRKKRKLLDVSPDSSDSESSSESSSSSSSKTPQRSLPLVPQARAGVSIQGSSLVRRAARSPACSNEEREFLARLNAFMKSRHTPINRVPTIGFKELDLYKLFCKVRHLGGYDAVTASRLWKYVYEEMGGDQSSTSAATCCRRHYERLLLPYEKHLTPNRSKAALAKLKKFDEISITTKTPCSNDRRKNLTVNRTHNKNPVIVRKVPRNKENIPLTHITSPEVIDLACEESPAKTKVSEVINLDSDSDDSPSSVKVKPSSNLTTKKQKLEILKEGGLEVTAITSVANGRPTPIEKPRASVIQPPRVADNERERGKEKVSITITPDVGHMLPNSQRHVWSLGSRVYGNPKEVMRGDPRSATDEILDLRTKNSNLEITLVPPSSSATQTFVKKPQLTIPMPHRQNHTQKHFPHPPRLLNKPALNQKIPTPVSNVPNGRGGIVPSVSISVNQQQKRKSKAAASPHASQSIPSYKAGPYSVMDPVYLSAFYSGLFTPYSTSATPQQVQFYKELLNQHNIPDSFPRLLQDGSTSISLVNQTPTPPSK